VVQTAEEGWKFEDEWPRQATRMMTKVKREKKTVHVNHQCLTFRVSQNVTERKDE
jgi:hypothetical protein